MKQHRKTKITHSHLPGKSKQGLTETESGMVVGQPSGEGGWGNNDERGDFSIRQEEFFIEIDSHHGEYSSHLYCTFQNC